MERVKIIYVNKKPAEDSDRAWGICHTEQSVEGLGRTL